MSISRNFPHDVLSDIFLLCLEGDDTVEDRRVLLAITATCSYWRRVALNRPGLWTRISWRTNNDNAHIPQNNPHNLERFSAYLKRSKNAPIFVSFFIVERFHMADGVPRSRESLRVDYDEAWSLLSEEHADHCRSLRIAVYFEASFRRFDVLPLDAAKFVRLEEVDIDGLSKEDDDRSAENAALFDSLSLAPLKAIRWRRNCDVCALLTPDVPTAKIQRLALPFQSPSLGCHDMDRITGVLQQCPLLTHLELDNVDWWSAIEPEQRVIMSNLKSLRVCHVWPAELQAMMWTPHLTSLSYTPKFINDIVSVHSDDEEGDLPDIGEFTGAMEGICGGNLRNLELKGDYTPDSLPLSNIRDMVLQNPLIASLRLVNWPLAWGLLWYIHPDQWLLSPMTLEKLGLAGEADGEDEGESLPEVDGEVPAETGSVTGAVARTSTPVLSQTPLLTNLEHLMLDHCPFESLDLVWKDLEALVRAVLRARPQLQISVYKHQLDVGPAFDPLVDEFGQRFRVVQVDAAEIQVGFFRRPFCPPTLSDVWWNLVTGAKCLQL